MMSISQQICIFIRIEQNDFIVSFLNCFNFISRSFIRLLHFPRKSLKIENVTLSSARRVKNVAFESWNVTTVAIQSVSALFKLFLYFLLYPSSRNRGVRNKEGNKVGKQRHVTSDRMLKCLMKYLTNWANFENSKTTKSLLLLDFGCFEPS